MGLLARSRLAASGVFNDGHTHNQLRNTRVKVVTPIMPPRKKNNSARNTKTSRITLRHQLRQSPAAQRNAPRPRKGTRAHRERQAVRDQLRNR